MGQRLTYRVERVQRSMVEVRLFVTDAELDTLNHSQLEAKAIEKVKSFATISWNTHEDSLRAALLHREERTND